MTLFWIILAISFPVFYIYGLIAFFRDLGKKESKNDQPVSDSKSLLLGIIKELSSKASESPNKTITELLEEYKKRTASIYQDTPAENVLFRSEPLAAPIEQVHKEKPQEDFFATWYSNNSINLLLYIGAFLIVAAAGIFVKFQWESISGVMKALLLTFVGFGFFGFGTWFYSLPKIKNAGSTFIAIAAILIPVIGAAWYTFVLAPAGIPVGVAWLLTSTVALVAYVSLALYMKTTFYAYASTIGTFSLMLSLVKSFDLTSDFYLLASIIACFILLFVSQQMKNISAKAADILALPADLSAQVAMPLTLIYGLVTALSDNKLFTLEGVLSVGLASLFYLIAYIQTKEGWRLALAEILLLVTMYILGNWLVFPQVTQYYILAMVSALLAGIGYYFTLEKKEEEADLSFVIGTFASVIVFLVSWLSLIPPTHQALLTLFPIGISAFTAWMKKSAYPLLITSSFFAVFLYIGYMKVFHYEKFPEYLGLLYLIQGVGRYILTFSLSRKQETQQVGHITIVSYSVLSLFLCMNNHWLLMVCTAVIAIMLFSTSILQKVQGVSFGGIFFSLVTVILFFHEVKTPYEYYPFILLAFAYALYGLSQLAEDHLKEELHASSLFISALSSIFFFFNRDFTSSASSNLNRNALLSAYATTILFGIDTVVSQVKNFGYVTSVVALATILWQINYLGYTNALMYTTPTGLYFLALAYTRRLAKDEENEKVLAGLGCSFLLIPPFFLSYGDEAMKYSLILGLEGILLVFTGISLRSTVLKAAGVIGIILAVLPQTYSYVLALPKWLIVGLGGLLFLTLAIFLLLKRKEE